MPYEVDGKLVVAVASSALFDLSIPHEVFRTSGTEAYREFQRTNENVPLPKGVAFPFIQRLLSMNAGAPDDPVEVILISRNDPDTGARVFRSMEAFGLPITRAAFLSGAAPYPYIKAFGACLFLSADETNVREAIMHDCPAGRVLASSYTDDPDDQELRIAFDFDGVIIDDEAERVYMTEGLERFQEAEVARALEAHSPGPLKGMLEEIGKLQRREIARAEQDRSYIPRIRTAIITARNAPAQRRVVTTLREWGIRVDQTFFLGGMDKRRILEVFKPHLYLDDQMTHAGPAAGMVPSVHVPFGVRNAPAATGTSGSDTNET